MRPLDHGRGGGKERGINASLEIPHQRRKRIHTCKQGEEGGSRYRHTHAHARAGREAKDKKNSPKETSKRHSRVCWGRGRGEKGVSAGKDSGEKMRERREDHSC